jgi:hypothetical protein
LCAEKVPEAKTYASSITIHVIGMAERKLKPKYEDTWEIDIKALGVSSFLS